MRTRLFVPSIVLLMGASALYACGGKKPPPKEPSITETVADAGADVAPPEPVEEKSLYERMGGKEAIAKVVDAFTTKLSADPKLKKRFVAVKGARLDKFKANLVNQLCQESGGDCKYAGKDMKAAHKGMRLTENEWTEFLGDLKSTLDDLKVPEKEAIDLATIIAPMHDDIVEVKPKAGKK